MTRGRKKDLTMPASRALIQQRDYRARKALYVSGLEERCKRLEEENDRLQEEIFALRAELPFKAPRLDPQLVEASSELMGSLNTTERALERFQRLAYEQGFAIEPGPPSHGQSLPESPSQQPVLRPAYLPHSNGPIPWRSYATPTPYDDTTRHSSPELSLQTHSPHQGYEPPASLRRILCSPGPSTESSPPSFRSTHSMSSYSPPPQREDGDPST